MRDEKYIQEDEIDLRELFKVIWDKIFFIIVLTSVVTVLSIIYVLIKNPTPIYKGTLLVEIGEIKTNESIFPIENPNNLKYILEAESEILITIPKRTNLIIQISAEDKSFKKINDSINNTFKKLIERQNKKLKIYKNFIPTKKIGNIKIDKKPVNQPKKKLIVVVSFITGFILSIFLVFFMNFIQGIKEEKKLK